jgi:hypothetical protein
MCTYYKPALPFVSSITSRNNRMYREIAYAFSRGYGMYRETAEAVSWGYRMHRQFSPVIDRTAVYAVRLPLFMPGLPALS